MTRLEMLDNLYDINQELAFDTIDMVEEYKEESYFLSGCDDESD